MSESRPADMANSELQDPPADPTIRVVSGNPSPEELAAVTAVLAALEADAVAAGASVRAPRGQTAWAESQRLLRTPLRVGPGQWSRHPA